MDTTKVRMDVERNLLLSNHKDAPTMGKKHACVLKESTQFNLGKKRSKKHVNGVNVSHTPSYWNMLSKSLLPQPFVYSTLVIVLSVLHVGEAGKKTIEKRLQVAKLDSRVILRRPIKTGKISAPLQF